MDVFGLWEEAGVPGENPHGQGRDMQAAPKSCWIPEDSTPEPSSYEATVLNTAEKHRNACSFHFSSY